MIIGDYFDNDPIWIQEVQHDLYMSNVATIFETARDIYHKSERVLGINTTLGSDAKEISSFDHRTIQYMHDIIAASFRYRNLDKIYQQIPGQQHVPGLIEDYSDRNYIVTQWLKYYIESIKNLYADYPSIIKQVLMAVTYSNPDKRGVDAESSIMETLSGIYCFESSTKY